MDDYDSDANNTEDNVSEVDNNSSILDEDEDYSVGSLEDADMDTTEPDTAIPKGGAYEGKEDDDSIVSDVGEDITHLFNTRQVENYILDTHPECISISNEELVALVKVVRNNRGIIIDDFHTTIPILTKYERTRVLGQRSVMIENGARVFVDVPPTVIDSMVIAQMELSAKKIPFIIKRPLPNNGFEYWKLSDLEQL